MVFDVENRLSSVGTTLTAGYDTNNLRAWKTDSTGTTYYLYAGNETSPVCELNSSGTVVATNTYTVNGLVSRNTSSGSTFYEFDPQGTVAERLNSGGTCTSSSTADAFGVVVNSTSVSDPFGYIGQAGYYTDLSTGLILTTFRYYDPGAGRFLNRDPSGYQGGIDLYGYVQNNSENFIDPSGYGGVASPGSGNHRIGNHCPCVPMSAKDAATLGDDVTRGLFALFLVLGIAEGIDLNPLYDCFAAAVASAVGNLVADLASTCEHPTWDDLNDILFKAAEECSFAGFAGIAGELGPIIRNELGPVLGSG